MRDQILCICKSNKDTHFYFKMTSQCDLICRLTVNESKAVREAEVLRLYWNPNGLLKHFLPHPLLSDPGALGLTSFGYDARTQCYVSHLEISGQDVSTCQFSFHKSPKLLASS